MIVCVIFCHLFHNYSVKNNSANVISWQISHDHIITFYSFRSVLGYTMKWKLEKHPHLSRDTKEHQHFTLKRPQVYSQWNVKSECRNYSKFASLGISLTKTDARWSNQELVIIGSSNGMASHRRQAITIGDQDAWRQMSSQ